MAVAVGLGLGVIVAVAVGVGVGVSVAVGVAVGVGVGVGVGLGAAAQYLPPVLTNTVGALPPQTIIWLVVLAHTAVWVYRAEGALVVLVAVQLLALGSYLPPVLRPGNPPQTIISLPVQTAV